METSPCYRREPFRALLWLVPIAGRFRCRVQKMSISWVSLRPELRGERISPVLRSILNNTLKKTPSKREEILRLRFEKHSPPLRMTGTLFKKNAAHIIHNHANAHRCAAHHPLSPSLHLPLSPSQIFAPCLPEPMARFTSGLGISFHGNRAARCKLLKKEIRHLMVIMLAGMDDDFLVLFTKFPGKRAKFNKLRACADDGEDFHFCIDL